MREQQPQRNSAATAVDGTLPRRFEALVAARPRAPLVVYGEWRLNYRDVNGAANRLAHRLMNLGVTRNVPVGLCLDRGPDLLVAILAVLKAGGAYVPLDPHWPADRLSRMRAAVNPPVLVTRSAFLDQLPDHPGPVVDLDRDQSVIAAESSTNPDVAIDRDQWCYVLFTSGSAGMPKGVPVTHGNLAGLFPPLTAALDLGPDDVWTWFHSASFGFSVWELWGALLHGGCLVIVPEHIRQDPMALGELIVDEQVTVFSQTPSAYRRVLHDARFQASVAGSRLRYLALSGEAIRREDIAGWLAHGHRTRLINTYAITETAGQLALRVYGAGDATEESARNLGKPLKGRKLLVLDGAGRPLPAGTAGELWVGGECVTPGYLSAPELSSRFSEIAMPGAGVLRGYLTGDRVRRLADGSLEYLGRVDAQLKFRGHRIEPGDIETALRDHPGVRDVAVALRADPAGNQRLTAYVVAGDTGLSSGPVADAAEFWPSLGAYGIYDQWLYGLMNAEPVRLAAYRAAFAAAVPGKVVLDIGTGDDAVLARLCVEAGASHVYAVEVLPGAARRATELVRSLGLQDRITVLHGDIAAIDLPRQVDVCTQGIIGNIGSADGIAAIWNSARRHFAAGCVPVPERCVTRIAALELPAGVRAQPRFGPLAADYARRLFATVGGRFDLRLCLRNVADADLLTDAAEFEVLDFTGNLAPEHTGSAALTVTRDGLLDGCLLWTVVTAGAGQAVDYFREQRAWLPVYLPLADEPLPVRRGDRLQLQWRCSLESDPQFPDYRVTARLGGPDGTVERCHASRHLGPTAGGTRLHRQLLAQLDAPLQPPTVTELRRWLDSRVPEHLVPQSWVFLPELPLGPGGKLDRDALPAPGGERPRLAASAVPPRSPAEHALASLWTEVLGLAQLGVEDDFFELGGDSISAVQLITRLQRWLDAGVPLAALFDAPTIAALARALEQRFTGPLAAALVRTPPLPALVSRQETRTPSTRAPLTFSQRSLWFLQALYPGDTSASEQFAIRLRGPLDPVALGQAWRSVLERHPVLTSRFVVEGEHVVSEMGTCLISASEMRHVPIFDESQLIGIAEAGLREPFDLTQGPLVRAVLCALSAESHILLVTAHHIVADGLSVAVLQADLAHFYVNGSSAGAAPAAPYADLARLSVWQDGTATPAALDWWRQRLGSLPPPPLGELIRPGSEPASEPASAVRLSRRVPFIVDADVADGLRRLARTGNATPFMALLAAFRVLLARLTGQPDLCIGTPMTLRDAPDLREVVGCLVNPVVLRVAVNLQASFRAHLQAERAAMLETFQFRTVPFSRVVEAVAPERELGVHPLFQVLFSWEPAMPGITGTPGSDGTGGVNFDILSVPAARASYYDLECALRDAGEGATLSGHVAWSTAVLEDWVAEQLPERLRTLLADVVARPDVPLERLVLLSTDERQRMLIEWNATAAPLPAERTLHEWFLAQAARTPDAVALRATSGEWSYGELAARSAALAAELARRGVRGRNVGVALGRSPELVLAVLAVLRAGGTVVPLDPGFPQARLQFIAQDADLALIVELVDGKVVGAPTGATVGVVAPVGAPTATDKAPAFLLYTSGSTGEPKGAFTTHESALNRCDWFWKAFGFAGDEVFALRTTINFIDAWWEIFGALGHGVPLQIVPDDVATDPLRLPGFLAQAGVTQLVLVPSLLQAMLDQVSFSGVALPALRWCITSGEPLAPDLVARCRQLLPRMTLLNTYGTSEIWDATAFDTRQLAPDSPRVPVGRPLANARVYIVDAAGEPVPPGIPGQLQVAGLGVGPGYWRRPELTAAKFARVVLPEVTEERAYRTGDRARFRADGHVECLGRLDAQLKLRGQRIEPEEIERHLAAHPLVAAALVGIVGEGGDAVLVAGIVRSGPATDADGAVLVEALRAHLQTHMPAWMLPTEWRELEALPLTPSGKLDRHSWLAGDAEARLLHTGVAEIVAPRTTVERQLAALWSELLGRTEIGVLDNFFHLGGHSLLAARLLTRIRATCGVQLELRALFAAPTVAGLAREIEMQRAAVPETTSVPSDSSSLPATLSFGQERLWFLEQLDPGSPAYNVAWTIHCTGPLHVPALRVALDALVARHPALRTRFPAAAGRPIPVIDPAGGFKLAECDLTGSAVRNPVDELAGTLTRLAREPFDLERGPLFRVTLLKTGLQDHHLLLVASHIVTDATSNHVLFADLAVAWAAALQGVPPDWPSLPLAYSDFARRQRVQSGAPGMGAALDWWRLQLAGAPPALELPTDWPRPAEQRFAGAWVQRVVPNALVDELSAFATRRGCTTYMVLLAAFKTLLHRYSGAVDLLVGTPVEGRLAADVETVVGLFINTLVIRTDLSGDPAFSTLLTRVRNATLDAQAHQEVPFEQLVEALAPERSLSRSPVFQVMFNLIQVPERTRRVGELALHVDRLIDQGVSSFDLTLTAAVERNGLALTFEYATDLFAAESMEQLADGYLTLLRSALREPGQALSRLPLLEADARRRLLELGQGHASALPLLSAPVHQVVAAQARRLPDAVAVQLGDDALTYAEIDTRANRLARHLIAHGAGAGIRIGISLPRTPDYLVAVLAVLKSGAAYVPLDPAYPAERLASMAADAALSGVIVNAQSSTSVHGTNWRAHLDADRAEIARHAGTDPDRSVHTEDAAYVLFTSGSTGRPKAVVVSHGNLSHALAGWHSAYDLRPGEAHLQMASAAFDVFTGDWVRALGTGGRLVLCPRDVLLDPPALLALLRTGDIRVAEFVPAVIRLLLEHCDAVAEKLPALRLLIVGSDTWYGGELEALRRISAAGTRLINSYGVAEATIDSCWFEASAATVDGPVPIGAPFPGVTAYVLDEHGEPAPRGVSGELCIGGGGVAVGYWNDARLTAEKFIPDPWAGTAGTRLYRTGDRARWNRSGQLELLGRRDAQLKLRGFRIEPAEIEACLTALPGVAAAAVGLQALAGGEPRLVAWVVPRGADAAPDRLQEALRRQLPEHLVPAAFGWLPALPLTPNGKVDRAALAALPVGAPTGATVAPVGAPTGREEAIVCQLFADLLGVERVGPDEDFFRVGGHSLLATRLVARLRDVLQTEVPLRTVFETPTPRGLVANLARLDSLPHPGPVARPRRVGEPVPLSPMQQRLWFLERLQPGTGAYHLHWLLRLRGPFDRAALQAGVDALAARHEVLRTAFIEREGVPVQIISLPLHIPVGAAAAATPADIQALIARPFDLATAPLLRVGVLELGPDDHQLLIVMHHLIADGWSFSVLSRELAAYYSAARHGGAVVLPALPLQYADYALWQQDTSFNARLQKQLKFWRSELAAAPPLLELPVDQVRPVVAGTRGTWVRRVVPAEIVAALRVLAIDEGCTLFMVLLAGFKVVLGRLAGRHDILVGTPVAGRSHRALEGLIGFFVNTLVIRTDLKGEPTFRELLGRVRHATLGAFDHADVPFEKLVEVLKPRRSLAHSPLVQVLFALHNQPRQPLELDGLRVTTETVESDTVKFDLNLHAVEEGDGLHLALAWRTDLYSAETVNGLLDQYLALLREAVVAPDQSLMISLVGAASAATGSSSEERLSDDGEDPVAAEAATAGDIELAVSAIFGELLGVPAGADEDFFDLGGHSLLATRLVAAIADRCGVELPLISVFEVPTIRGLACRVSARQAQALPPMQRIPRLPRRADPGEAR